MCAKLPQLQSESASVRSALPLQPSVCDMCTEWSMVFMVLSGELVAELFGELLSLVFLLSANI